jgi:glycosyltransferase involved in cell wall biosynthesis
MTVVSARREFGRLLEELNPDATVFHGSWSHGMFAPVAKGLSHRVAFWQHAPITNPRWPDRWASWTRPDVLIANSRFTASAPAFSGISPSVIHCPVLPVQALPPSERVAARQQLFATDSDVVVLMAARLEEWKGHSILIEAAARLNSRTVKVWIAGGVQRRQEEAYFEDLQRAAASAGNVTLLGQRNDTQRLMAVADVYCQPNTAPEPFGLAIAEAMSAGVPCVVSDSGGATELVNDQCGVLTSPGNSLAVADALHSLVEDPLRRAALGAGARRRAALLADPVARLDQLADALSFAPASAAHSRATVV